jgi:phosphoglycerate dehydrogenase-like enzyme
MYVRDNELTNLVMTPHVNGWTIGTVLRTQQTIAENIRRLSGNEALLNVPEV